MMKALIAVVMLMGFAFGQSTTSVVNKDGSVTKITVNCDHTGDCVVRDSTGDLSLKERSKRLKAEKEWCKEHNLPTNMVKAYDESTMLGGKNMNRQCDAAWVEAKQPAQ